MAIPFTERLPLKVDRPHVTLKFNFDFELYLHKIFVTNRLTGGQTIISQKFKIVFKASQNVKVNQKLELEKNYENYTFFSILIEESKK